MEQDELKMNWTMIEERLAHLEMNDRKLLKENVNSKLERMRRRLLVNPYIFLLLGITPFCLNTVVNEIGYDFSLLTYILFVTFTLGIVFRQFYFAWLLKRIDCVRMPVREICLAEHRFRLAFNVGIVASLVLAAFLMTSLIWDLSKMGDPHVMLGAWVGLVIGSIIGYFKFRKVYRSVQELQKSIADLEME